MVRMFCVLKNIGGISGNRVYIRRLNRIIYVNKGWRIFLNTKQDTLRCRDLKLIDKFILLANRSGDLDTFDTISKDATHSINSNNTSVCILDYFEGEIKRMGLISFSKLINFFENNNLVKEAYSKEIYPNQILSFNKKINFDTDSEYWAELLFREEDLKEYCRDGFVGNIDIDKITTTKDSLREDLNKFKIIIKELSEKENPFDIRLLKKSASWVNEDRFRELIKKLYDAGEIFSPKLGYLQVI